LLFIFPQFEPIYGLCIKSKLAKRRVCGVERLVRYIGVETWTTDRLFPRYFYCLLVWTTIFTRFSKLPRLKIL